MSLLEVLVKNLQSVSRHHCFHSVSPSQSDLWLSACSHQAARCFVMSKQPQPLVAEKGLADQSGLRGVASHCSGWAHKTVPLSALDQTTIELQYGKRKQKGRQAC